MADTVEVIILARDEASKTIGGIRGALGGLGGAVGTVAKVGTAAFLGVGAAAVGGFGLALNASIGMNAQLEQSTMMFTTLMGDAQLAEEHVKSLFDFAAATPYETGPIIEASKHLEVFGGAALNTMDNLTLIGDAASAVGAPIDEVGFWVGRLYSQLMAGRPFGEAAMRLQELGIMAPTARNELEAMQAAGAEGTAIWSAFQGSIEGFSGAMELQSQSWVGLTSTIKDQVNLMMAEALRPFFELLKTGLASLAAWLSSPEIQAGIQTLAANIGILVARLTEFVTGSVIPFVQEHGPQLKAVLIALTAAFAGLLIIGAVAAAIAVLTNPITWVIAAIGALAAAWTMNWGGIQEKTAAVVGFLRDLISGFVTAVTAWWDAHGAAIVATAERVWGLIKDAIDGAIKTIKLIFDAFRLAFEGDWEALGAKLYEIWVTAWTTVTEFLGGLWDMVLPWLMELWSRMSGWFQSIDWGSLGRSIIDGIISGLLNAAGALWDAISGIIQGARAAAGAAAGEGSPARLFIPLGESIVQGVIEGIENEEDNALATLEALVGRLGDVSGLAGGFSGLFERRWMAPAQAGLDAINARLEEFAPTLDGLLEGFGVSLNSPGLYATLQRMATSQFSSDDQRREATMALALLDERTNLMQQQAGLQETLIAGENKLLMLETQRQELAFLQQQFDLLKLINDNGLDPQILNGMTFGLDADPADFMNAMIEAMGSLITATNAEIIGLNPTPVERSFFDKAANGYAGPQTVINIDATGAQAGTEQKIKQVVEEVMRDYGVRADIRMRTG